MLNIKEIRVGSTNLENHLYDWLEENIADWEELSYGSRRVFLQEIELQLETAAADGVEIQTAQLLHSYCQWYTCPADLRPYLIIESLGLPIE